MSSNIFSIKITRLIFVFRKTSFLFFLIGFLFAGCLRMAPEESSKSTTQQKFNAPKKTRIISSSQLPMVMDLRKSISVTVTGGEGDELKNTKIRIESAGGALIMGASAAAFSGSGLNAKIEGSVKAVLIKEIKNDITIGTLYPLGDGKNKIDHNLRL